MSGHLCCCTLLLFQVHTGICVACAWITGDVRDERLCCLSCGTHIAGKVDLFSQHWREDCFILIFVTSREGKGLSKGTVCSGAPVTERGFSKAGAQGTTQEDAFTAAFMPVAYPLLHREFCPVAFQGFPYPEVKLIIPQKLPYTASVAARLLASD